MARGGETCWLLLPALCTSACPSTPMYMHSFLFQPSPSFPVQSERPGMRHKRNINPNIYVCFLSTSSSCPYFHHFWHLSNNLTRPTRLCLCASSTVVRVLPNPPWNPVHKTISQSGALLQGQGAKSFETFGAVGCFTKKNSPRVGDLTWWWDPPPPRGSFLEGTDSC